jgi:hypothetical protein
MLNLLLNVIPFVGRWWDQIPETVRFLFAIAAFLVPLLVLTIVIYLAGILVVGGRRARFSDAFLIALLGTIVSIVLALFVSDHPLILLIVEVIVWLVLIKSFFNTGWLGALAVGILSVVVFIVVLFILALLFAVSFVLFEKLFSLALLGLL